MPSFIGNLKFLILATSYLLLTAILSGCSAIGSSKPAALQATSVPEASVFLDGKHLGKTPFFSQQLKSGEYLLKITASEASYVDKITLTGGTLTAVNRELASNFLAQSGENLWLKPGQKGLFISSLPNEADVTIDGVYIGKTPLLTFEIKEGEHKVLLSAPSYIDREFAIKTSDKYQLLADVTLASEIAKGLVPSQAPLSEPKKIEIVNTPLGFLRVRKEPSVNAIEVGRVKTGDQLEVIQETEDWVKIKFEAQPDREAGKLGWVSAQYTKKL